MTYTELQNSPELTLAVHFVGEADQVTQLFPQNILGGMGYPLDIQVILKVGLQWSRGHVRDIYVAKAMLCLGRGSEDCSHFWPKPIELNSRTNSETWRNPGALQSVRFR